MSLQLYSTLTHKKEIFTPLEPGVIKLYVCGMTVYDYCHIGHARVMVSFDVIARWLRHSGYKLTYVRNITDIDDKIIRRAVENKESIDDLTQRMIDAMHDDERALMVLPPDLEPKATDHIDGMQQMIGTLMDKAYAYAPGNGDVYFRVRNFPTYGQLSRKKLDDLQHGIRVDVDENKESPLDFVLWKAAKPTEPAWSSPWGQGRPGWHIECSVMSTQCLGNTFDIHGGGPDLVFPHHENEIAQSEASTNQCYARYWMHAGPVRADGEKMSKSLGNFFTIREVLKSFPAEVLRFWLVSSHYRSPISFSPNSLNEAKSALDRLYQAMRGLEYEAVLDSTDHMQATERFSAAMNDDFNTPEACAELFELAREANRLRSQNLRMASQLAVRLRKLGGILGLLQDSPEAHFQGPAHHDRETRLVENLIEARAKAKDEKNWAKADDLRQQLTQMGVLLEDTPQGTQWKWSEPN